MGAGSISRICEVLSDELDRLCSQLFFRESVFYLWHNNPVK